MPSDLLIALAAATLPTFISLVAAGAGATRLNGGPFGKTERCLAAVVAAALPQYLAIIAWVIIMGSAVTACVRLARTATALAGRTGPATKFFTDLIQVSVEQLLTHVSQTKLK